MKKLYRLFAIIFVLMIGTGIAVGTGVASTAYADGPNGLVKADEVVKIKGIPTQATLGGDVTINSMAGATLEVKFSDGTVVRQYNTAVEEEATAYSAAKNSGASVIKINGDNTYTFTPAQVGYYTIQYTYEATNGVTVVTPEYRLSVTKDGSYTGKFEYNSEIVLPAQVGLNTKIVLPYPAAYDENGTLLIDYTGTAKVAGYAYKVVVKMDGKTLSSAETGDNALTKNSNGYYEFTAQEGINTVNYVLTKDGIAVADLATKTISCDAGYDATAINLSMTVTGLPTTSSASVGSKNYLPLPTVQDKGNVGATINFYTIVKVKFGDTDVTVSKDDKGLYFIPTEVGDYTISYNVKDVYGKTLANDYTTTIKNIHDTKSPEIYIVDTYYTNRDKAKAYDAEFIADLKTAKYDIPYKINRTTAITFPALYAVDEYKAYENLTLTRKITIGSTTIDLNAAKYHTYDSNDQLAEGTYETITEGDDTRYVVLEKYRNMFSVVFKFSDGEYEDGDYTVTYRASDNTTASTSFTRTLTLGNYNADDTKVNLSFESFPTVVRDGEEVTITPVVTDTYDNDIKVTYTIKGEAVVANDDKTLTFTATGDLAVDGKITIVVTAANDFKQSTSVTKTINFVGKTTDNVCPEAADGTVAVGNTFNQYDWVYVDGVAFTDADPYVRVYFEVREITADGYKVITGAKLIGNTITDGIKFKGNNASAYLITYIAEDSSNNITVVGIKTKDPLTDKQAPVINRESKEYTMELGTELDLGEIVATDNSGANPTITVTSDSEGALVADTLFVPRAIGSYTITINAVDNDGNEADPVKLIVNVKDTTKPVIVVNNGDVYDSNLRVMPNENGKFSEITLPSFSAYDVQTISASLPEIGIAKSEIKIAGPNSTTYTLDSTSDTYKITKNDNGTYKFTPASKGTYTITYSATDLNGNTADNVTITLTAGDTVPPVISVSTDIPASANKGYAFTVKKSEITVTDAVDGALNYKELKLLDANGTEVEATKNDDSTEFTYTLENAGTYTLQVTAQDKAGNVQTYTKSISVSEPTAESVNKTEVVGIILIVLAALVVAGVILFFVFTRKKKANIQK